MKLNCFPFFCVCPKQMTSILSELPKTYSDSARAIIQQHLRRNTSGTNSPSSPLSCSSPKLLLSPQLGPMSLQNHYPSKYSVELNVVWNFFFQNDNDNYHQVHVPVNHPLKQMTVHHQ